MTVNEVLKNVNKSLVHFAIFESTNSTESMYENVDTIKIRGKFVHPKNFYAHWKSQKIGKYATFSPTTALSFTDMMKQ